MFILQREKKKAAAAAAIATAADVDKNAAADDTAPAREPKAVKPARPSDVIEGMPIIYFMGDYSTKFGFGDNSVREKDCRKRGTQAT